MNKNYKPLSGSEALVKGAVFAGASFYAGYPITPSSDIMHQWAKLSSKDSKYSFIQMEDEIASVHALIGASLAGKKSFTATSGPGFTLMQEGLGMAFVMQVPLVVINSQRQGPATGMPTIGSQGDVLQTQFGTHGDYVSIVFAPNSVKEMYQYMIEAFNASEESLSPVILLTDAYITHLHEEEDLSNMKKITVREREKKGLGKDSQDRHFSGLTTKQNGIVDTLSPEVYTNWIKQRKQSVLKTGRKYYFYEKTEKKKAKTLLVSYGITSRLVNEIVEKEENFSHFRPITLFPIKENILKNIANKYDNIVVIEMNEGQYANQIQSVLCRKVNKIRVLGAEPSKKDILKQLKNI